VSRFPSNARLMKGAFVELVDPDPPDPVVIPFQFNPETITRTKRVKEPQNSTPGGQARSADPDSIALGEATKDLEAEWEGFTLTVRLDAQDAIAAGDQHAETVGVAHMLATFEKLVTPQPGGQLIDRNNQPDTEEGYSYGTDLSIPVVLFCWGEHRAIPVYVNSLQIEEVQHMPNLYPIRAILTVSVKVLEGPVDDPVYLYTYQESQNRESLSEDFEDSSSALGGSATPTI
jgi:hypothetical protein